MPIEEKAALAEVLKVCDEAGAEFSLEEIFNVEVRRTGLSIRNFLPEVDNISVSDRRLYAFIRSIEQYQIGVIALTIVKLKADGFFSEGK